MSAQTILAQTKARGINLVLGPDDTLTATGTTSHLGQRLADDIREAKDDLVTLLKGARGVLDEATEKAETATCYKDLEMAVAMATDAWKKELISRGDLEALAHRVVEISRKFPPAGAV